MENEKNPSRFGVRLSAVIMAVLLVVCMAVPAFAASVDVPENGDLPPFSVELPEGYDYYFAWPLNFNTGWGYNVIAFESMPTSNQLYVTSGGRLMIRTRRYSAKVSYSGVVSSWEYETNYVETSFRSQMHDSMIGNVRVYNEDGSLFFGSPPDINENVTSGLFVVLEWVGAVVSAVVSGPMSGLLILLAVPVAITLLLVAFIVIRRIIWGA